MSRVTAYNFFKDGLILRAQHMKDSSPYWHQLLNDSFIYLAFFASNNGPSNTVGTESDCRSRDSKSDPGLVPCFPGLIMK